MRKYLIFRTDRIGDFIFSRLITHSIKENNSKNQIDIICSKYNSNYVRNYKDIKNIYILDKWDIKKLLSTAKKINRIKYDCIIVLDGKRRSIFFSIFLNSKYKIAVLKDFRPFIILKLFFNKYLINTENFSQFSNFKTLLNYLNFKVPVKIDYFKNYNLKKKIFSFKKNYFLIHIDEKWFDGYYYNDYDSINLNFKNFDKLVLFIFRKFKKNIVISSGNLKIKELDLIVEKHFSKSNNGIYISKKYKNNLIFVNNTKFQDIENLVKDSSYLLCCEGAISHVSNVFAKKTFAIINKRNIRTAKFWTDHMKNIRLIYRSNINEICKNILKGI